ncbi:FmdB family zinc ribbon protein [Rubrobacter calidifluminis]|uniref:FmdB family zinc ribbon protein n=1 Tax=Rubrobacter calidifluminis TaxID=1392640 RepID=UPI002361593D|nr:zinc ribbon domain-containing protein [Rubrobacter calidifluminis]
MALYEYRCAECEEHFDLMRPMSQADEPARCPECGSDSSERVITASFASMTTGASAPSSSPSPSSGGGCCGGGCGCGCG